MCPKIRYEKLYNIDQLHSQMKVLKYSRLKESL